MATSDASWPGNLRKITELERPDHSRLEAADRVYFVGEYTTGANWRHSATNQLIFNLKKRPSLQGTLQYQHKFRAIADAGKAIGGGLKPASRQLLTFVPIPPSKLPADEDYDDRMALVAQAIGPDVRRMITLGEARDAAHEKATARDPTVLKAKLRLDPAMLEPRPRMIALVDDLLTTGCSFKACQSLIADHLPDVPVIGLFVARRKLPPPFEGFDVDF